MSRAIERTDLEPAWLSNLHLALQASPEDGPIPDLALSAAHVDRWLDANMVKGNRANVRVVARAIRAYFHDYDWREINLSECPESGPVAIVARAARRLCNVFKAAQAI